MTALLSLVVAASVSAANPQSVVVRFKTVDGWTIAGLYHAPKKDAPVAVLVHGVAAGKGEWWRLSESLWTLGYGTLAIDLRGHGESTRKGTSTVTYESFDRTGQWPRAEADVAAAVRYLKGKGIPASRVGLIGGSIGANLVSQTAAKEPKVRWVVLLSPGQDYRGVGVADLSGRKAVAAASPSDAYAHQTAVELGMTPGGPAYLEAKQGHGAQLIDDPQFLEKLLEWLKKNG